jgi:hypothetical protein
VLLLEQCVALLEIGELPQLHGELAIELDLGRLAAQSAFAYLLAPAREHERVDVEGLGDLLDLDTGKLAQANGAELELQTVAVNPRKLLRAGHWDTSIALGRGVN